MSATCDKCAGSGQLPGSVYLDCTNCDVAMIRVGVETWAKHAGIDSDEDELWAIFKYGQSTAFEQAAKVCDSEAYSRWEGSEISMAEDIAKAIRSLNPATPRQQHWNNVAAGLVEVKTAAERAAEDRHHKPHAVYVEQEVAELRARLVEMSQKESA